MKRQINIKLGNQEYRNVISWLHGFLIIKVIYFLLFVAAGLSFTPSVVTGEEVIVVKGTLTTERCMKEPVCYLEWYKDPSSLVLFTGTRTEYHLELGEVPKWKLSSGFGKQVAIRGVIEGKKIKVYDIIPLSGGGKMSKACL